MRPTATSPIRFGPHTMPDMSCCRRIILLVLLSGISFPALATTPTDYVGQYVLRIGSRNFIVLNLRDLQGALTGNLSRPRQSSLGSFFSNISAEVITEPITSA